MSLNRRLDHTAPGHPNHEVAPRWSPWPWEATAYFLLVVVGVLVLASVSIEAVFAGLVIHVASYQLGRP